MLKSISFLFLIRLSWMRTIINYKFKLNMKILFLLTLLLSTFSYGQKMKFKVIGQKDTTVFLVKYYGKGLFYADTAEIKGG